MPNMENLWRQYKKNNDQTARQQIISNYAYLAKYVVDRMLVRPNSVIGYDDLVSHAIIGLIDAVEKFDIGKAVKFETYACVRIRGSVLDAIKDLDWTPRSVRASEQEIKRAFADLEAELGHPADDSEVAARLGISVDELNEILAGIGQSALLSLEELMVTSDDNTEVAGLTAGVPRQWDPTTAAELSERKRMLADAIEALPDREKLVISLYYREDLTLKEIAAVLGVTESRACQLHSKAVVRLHGKLARHAELLLAA